MKIIKSLSLFLALGMIVSGCSKDDSSAGGDSASQGSNATIYNPGVSGSNSNNVADENPEEAVPEEETVPEGELLYGEILDQYREYLFQGADPSDIDNNGILWMHMNWGEEMASSGRTRADLKVGYELLDIDENGVLELIIYHSDMFDHDQINSMREVYTIQDGEPHLLLVADTKYLISVREDAVLEGGYASYDWETLGFDDQANYHNYVDGEMIPLHDMDKNSAPEMIAIGELTMLEPDLSAETEAETDGVDGSPVLSALKEAITLFFEDTKQHWSDEEKYFVNTSYLTTLSEEEKEEMVAHIVSILGDIPVEVSTRDEITAQGYYFAEGDGRAPSSAGPDDVRFEHYMFSPSISENGNDLSFTLSHTTTLWIYSATWNEATGDYTVKFSNNVG